MNLLLIVLISCGSVNESSKEKEMRKAPKLINEIMPVYPEAAKEKDAEGIVELFLFVSVDGNVTQSNVVETSGDPILDSAAIAYTKKLRFNPTVENDEAVAKWIKWKVNYQLKETVNGEAEFKELDLLVFTKTNDFIHESRTAGKEALERLAERYNFNIYFTEDSLDFNEKFLARFDVVVWLSTSGDVLGTEEQIAFESYIGGGGNYVGIHGASATEYDWEWYGNLVGTFFDEHPKQQTAIVKVIDPSHPSTKHLPEEWERYDEWYNWRSDLVEEAKVLLTVDETTYEGGKHPDYHPVSWCRELPGGGRSWYTALGHRAEHYSDENFIQHILGGIIWAANGKLN